MRTLALTLGFLGLAAGPCLALTVQSAPNRDQAPHLTQGRSGAAPLSQTWAGSQRPMEGSNYSGRAAVPSDVRSYSFGNVTTTVRAGDSYDGLGGLGFYDRSFNDGRRVLSDPLMLRAADPRRR